MLLTSGLGGPGSIPGSGRSAGEEIGYPLQHSWAFLVAHLVKNSPAMRETWVQPLGWRRERLPTPVFWPGEFRGPYSPWGCKELDTTEWLSLSNIIYSAPNSLFVQFCHNFWQTTADNIPQIFLCKIADCHCFNTIFCCYPFMFVCEFVHGQQSGAGVQCPVGARLQPPEPR